MEKLKSLKYLCVFLLGFTVTTRALAGIPVFDNTSVTQQILSVAEQVKQVAAWAQQFQQMEQQFQQMQQQYASLNGVRGMASLVNNPSLRNYLPSDYQTILTNGYGNSASILAQNKRIHFSDTWIDPASQTAIDHQNDANQAAINRAVAEDGYAKASQRFSEIQVLLDKINDAPDAKDIADLQARIQAEQVMQQNEATKLAMLSQLAQAQRDLQNQRNMERSIAKDAVNTIPNW